jgi:hypothetical protein
VQTEQRRRQRYVGGELGLQLGPNQPLHAGARRVVICKSCAAVTRPPERCRTSSATTPTTPRREEQYVRLDRYGVKLVPLGRAFRANIYTTRVTRLQQPTNRLCGGLDYNEENLDWTLSPGQVLDEESLSLSPTQSWIGGHG